MTDKNIEMMKKIIEEKKMKGSKSNLVQRPEKNTGHTRKAIRSGKKSGGLFDK